MNLSNKHAAKRTKEAIDAAVAAIGCEPEAFAAVIAVETRDRGYDRHGRLIALFEPHKFYALLKKHKPSELLNAVSRGLAYPRQGERPYPKDSYPRIVEAMKIDEELALQAASWGLPQILGSNYAAAGYKSARDMVTSFLQSEDDQIAAMARVIVAWGLGEALRSHAWEVFARAYNGPAFKKNAYDTKLAKAYAAAKRKSAITKAAPAVIVAGGAAAATTQSNSGGALVAFGLAAAIALIIVLAARARRRAPAPAPEPMRPVEPEFGAAEIVAALHAQTRALDRLAEVVADLREQRPPPPAPIGGGWPQARGVSNG